MIKGLGTDIIEVARVKQAMEKCGFTKRVFTKNELEWLSTKGEQSAAGLFAAKEACLKALGAALLLSLSDIEITHEALGKPTVVLHGKAEECFKQIGATAVSVSISHISEYAVATCVVE